MLPINTFNVHVRGVYFAKLVFYTPTRNMVPFNLKLRLNELQGFGNYQKGTTEQLVFFDKEPHLDLYDATLMLRRGTYKPHGLINNSTESKSPNFFLTPWNHKNAHKINPNINTGVIFKH